MSSLFLDVENHIEVEQFIHEQAFFLSAEEQATLNDRLETAGSDVHALGELAREVAKKTWAVRQAIHQFAETQAGCEEEWRLVVGAVSKSTAHLLERFRQSTTCTSLDETVAHEESASAFREQELREIAAVRQQVRMALWRDRQEELQSFADEAQQVFQAIADRMNALRELAADTPWIEGEVFAKVAQFEDDFLFAGKEPSLERLDEEIAYYREQKALPVT